MLAWSVKKRLFAAPKEAKPFCRTEMGFLQTGLAYLSIKNGYLLTFEWREAYL